MMRTVTFRMCLAAILAVSQFAGAEPAPHALPQGAKIVLVGGAFAERLQEFGQLETQLHARFPQHGLVLRNLGWPGDEVGAQQRPPGFERHGHSLAAHAPDQVWAFFGANEAFAGLAGLPQFRARMRDFIAAVHRLPRPGRSPAQVVLFTPLPQAVRQGAAHQAETRSTVAAANERLRQYAAAVREVAAEAGVRCVDLSESWRQAVTAAGQPLTQDGLQLTAAGDRWLAERIVETLFGRGPPLADEQYARLRREVNEKDRLFFFDYRTVNGLYVFGERREPFGVQHFPAEFAHLRRLIAARDRRIWDAAQGKPIAAWRDEPAALAPPQPHARPAPIATPAEALAQFSTGKGLTVELFASEEQFPELANPIQIGFDARGRLWVCTAPSYPHFLPGAPPDDKLLILEDRSGDGRADRCQVFARGLYLPTGFALTPGGAYVAQQPNLVLLRDTDGDDRADERSTVLHGFGTVDAHHALHTFTWDECGGLYFQEGTLLHTQVETPRGVVRCRDGGVYRFEPRTGRLEVAVSHPFANPWGHARDGWGRSFFADASTGGNYLGSAISGAVDYPHKHGQAQQFLVKEWRPTSACTLVSSRHFLPGMQGDYLLANCLGFQGVLHYALRDEGAGVRGQPLDPLLGSREPSFRPVDMQLGPDGALYLCDWCNPIIGHLQYSLRDPRRDHTHGRIWRLRYRDRPLSPAPAIAGQPLAQLFQLLETESETATRQRVRQELHSRAAQQVLTAADVWLRGRAREQPHFELCRQEVLWLQQALGEVQPELLARALEAPVPQARAAATRLLIEQRFDEERSLALLGPLMRDAHPAVRLEAVRGLSFFRSQKARELALESAALPQDDYLRYVLAETLQTLDRRLQPAAPGPQ